MNLISQSTERMMSHRSTCLVAKTRVRSSTRLSQMCRIAGGGMLVILLLILAGLALGSQAFAKDPLGTASVAKHNGTGACPSGGLSGGTCWDVNIWNCPQTGDTQSTPYRASVKVNASPTPVGFVFFTTGGGGTAYYDNYSGFLSTTDTSCPPQGAKFNCGLHAVQTVHNASFTTIQTNFSDPNGGGTQFAGWLTGPASGSTDGPRAMACRYATLVHAVWTSPIINNATQKPICTTGNSAGSSAAAYALTQYGMSTSTPGPLLSLVEATSGPPMGRIDHGCSHSPQCLPVNCGSTPKCPSGQLKEGYGVGTALMFIDPAYDGDDTTLDSADICSQEIQNNIVHDTLFHHDSVLSDDFAVPNYPHTYVNFVFGAADGSSAVPLGTEWYNAITSGKPAAPVCVSGAPHELSSTFAGASQVASDINGKCKLY